MTSPKFSPKFPKRIKCSRVHIASIATTAIVAIVLVKLNPLLAPLKNPGIKDSEIADIYEAYAVCLQATFSALALLVTFSLFFQTKRQFKEERLTQKDSEIGARFTQACQLLGTDRSATARFSGVLCMEAIALECLRIDGIPDQSKEVRLSYVKLCVETLEKYGTEPEDFGENKRKEPEERKVLAIRECPIRYGIAKSLTEIGKHLEGTKGKLPSDENIKNIQRTTEGALLRVGNFLNDKITPKVEALELDPNDLGRKI
ncbi:hypothetical protein ACUH92_04560 [Dermabacteraceae bacterium CCM 9520]